MGLFGRGGKADADTAGARASADTNSDEPAVPEDDAPDLESIRPASEHSSRGQGPWDVEDSYPDVPRVDLGALRIPQSDAYRIQVQADPSSGTVTLVSLVTDTSAVQLQPYAAPRSGGMWDDIRSQIKSQINKSGGLVEEVAGPFGTELRAQVRTQGQQPGGADVGTVQPARFCGVDGPRWFLRMVFLGQAARDPQAAAVVEAAARSVVVVRGGQAMPVGNAIPMRVPVSSDATEAVSAAPTGPVQQRPTITLPERGPEITETR